MCMCVLWTCSVAQLSAAQHHRLDGVSRTHVFSNRHTSVLITHLSHNYLHCQHCQQLSGVSRTHVMSHELTFLFIRHTSLFITQLSHNYLQHTANNLVVFHEHTSWATNSHFFSSHICHRTVCGTPPTTWSSVTNTPLSSQTHIFFHHTFISELPTVHRQRLHKNTSVVTNSSFFSSHICRRALFGTLPSTWSLVTNSRLSS